MTEQSPIHLGMYIKDNINKSQSAVDEFIIRQQPFNDSKAYEIPQNDSSYNIPENGSTIFSPNGSFFLSQNYSLYDDYLGI